MAAEQATVMVVHIAEYVFPTYRYAGDSSFHSMVVLIVLHL